MSVASDLNALPQASAASPVDSDEGIAQASPKELKKALYARCATRGIDKIFDQSDLLGLGVIPNDDLVLLQACTNQLTREGLLKVLKKDSGVCWKVIRKEDAAK